MGNNFSKIFLPIFGVILLVGLITVCVWPRLLKRRGGNILPMSDSTELANIARNPADITRLSAAFPPHPTIRVFDGPPRSALSARRREVISQRLPNPFIDPPSSYNPSIVSFTTVATTNGNARSDHSLAPLRPTADEIPDLPAYRNFSTPTRKTRFSSSNHTLSTPTRAVYPPPQILFSSSSAITVPERAHMPAVKPAGRAPPLGPRLAKFPMPHDIIPSRATLPPSSSSRRHLHPNKLFARLSKEKTPTSRKSTTATATTTPTIPSSPPVLPPAPISPFATHSKNITASKSEASFVTTSSPISSLHSSSSPDKPSSNPNVTINPPSGVRSDLPVHYEITTTLPKPTSTGALTPVSTIRDMFDRKATENGSGNISTSSSSESLSAVPAAGTLLAPPAAAKLRASSIYSRDEEGNSVVVAAAARVVGVQKPVGKAPGGAEWI